MEKFADTVKDLLEEKLALFQELKIVFQQEKDCIVNIDIDSLWHTITLKKKIGLKIAAQKERILSLFKENYALTDMDMASFSLPRLIGQIPGSDTIKLDISKLKNAILAEMEEVKAIAQVNSKHVNSYLLVIDDVFSTIMSVTDKKQYNSAGPVANGKKGNCLIREEV
ncbi:MAG: flagellar protein FlgN [Desulfobacteraceae bacterium]|nr:flagellar protein FlgN [Desulfobacteraceae bacterium]